MRTAVVICPGRGTYNATELGYLGRYFPDSALLAEFDIQRSAGGQQSLTELDGADRFHGSRHTRGDNASGLIFAASYGDFWSIERDRIKVVAVTGNSMGWYTALACAGAASPADGFRIANTMGGLMQRALIGGQTIYPFTETDWRPQPARRAELIALIGEIARQPDHLLDVSIELGGMLVVAGNELGLNAFERAVEPVQQRFPMRLSNHAAFHTALQAPVAAEGRRLLPSSLLRQPMLPLIDGRGAIWWPGACDIDDLWDYTLGAQVTQAYNFTRAIAVAAREFAPDLFIVAGPGATLGGAVAQALILAGWKSMTCKDDFQNHQAREPLLVSMGMPEQRANVIKGD